MRRHVDEQLEAYLAGELSRDAERVFQEHLRRCRRCEQALEEAQGARSYLAWLLPQEAPPVPGPGFYLRVQRAIERRTEASWLAVLARSWQPRLAYPLLLLGLLFAAWTMTFEMGTEEENVFGFPPSQYATVVSPDVGRLESRDLVMTTLVEVLEGN